MADVITRAREATAALRDAAREGRVIEFRQRDPLVLAIHAVIDLAEQAEAALTQARAEGRREGLESLRREFEAWRDVELREQPSRPAVDVLRVAVNAINANIAAGDALRASAPHTCHDMNPPHPASCSACERERALATSPATPAPQEGT